MANPTLQPENEEIEVTELVERLDALEKENRTQEEKLEKLRTDCDALRAGLDGAIETLDAIADAL